MTTCLEDHPKRLITMVIVTPLGRVVGPLPNGHSWLITGGDPNHLLTGVILQVLGKVPSP